MNKTINYTIPPCCIQPSKVPELSLFEIQKRVFKPKTLCDLIFPHKEPKNGEDNYKEEDLINV